MRRCTTSSVIRRFSKRRFKLRSGRRASRTAYDAERRTIVEVIVPHAPRGNAVRDALRHTVDQLLIDRMLA
ncbi:hypothetical protein CTI50_27120 [Pseudomonas syringae pv. actinidiae]|nr:hypothetical protein CS297_04700 [Pseudomonas syringae pv. actinidiae]PIB89622.1 hypothetical protein CS296_00880 [Pseudomonas syringae pv. actinidiae]PIH65867.1 hypothetical protein CS298_07045 [Pseudomonas syringae pv. actinidiae]PIH69680.1 hypothetical protein CS299_16220 [Pseudomonas syringae pv. actinidiae]PIH78145.1 hypothetical protein CS300_00395 [Pseudomonas syringae pv. actinidiae]